MMGPQEVIASGSGTLSKPRHTRTDHACRLPLATTEYCTTFNPLTSSIPTPLYARTDIIHSKLPMYVGTVTYIGTLLPKVGDMQYAEPKLLVCSGSQMGVLSSTYSRAP